MSKSVSGLKRAWDSIPSLFVKNWQKSSHLPPVKYTVQPVGIWKTINKFLAVDPNRSTGIPLNLQFRNPTPGGLDPNTYDDPTTVPAADIADNPYWKRDVRRNYPKLSSVTQGDVVALLSVGSAAAPKDDVLQLGDAGKKQLVEVKQSGEEKGLASFFQGQKNLAAAVLSENGLPPMPPALNNSPQIKRYEMGDQSYSSAYPCRNFE